MNKQSEQSDFWDDPEKAQSLLKKKKSLESTVNEYDRLSSGFKDISEMIEIAEELEVSRAAVYDSLRSAESLLHSYEEKLGILDDYLRRGKLAEELWACISEVGELLNKASIDCKSKDKLDKYLAEATELIDELD